MSKWLFILAPLFIFSCKEEVADTWFTPEKANYYISRITELCNRDSGKLWGRNLDGPLLFIDRPTRKIFTNQPVNISFLKLRDGIYSGILPKEEVISRNIIELGGTTFSTVRLPVEEDEYRVTSRAIRNLFHLYQRNIGIIPSGYDTRNKDDKESRLWLKLEWKALEKAIISKEQEREQAIRDALIFRGTGREINPKHITDENRFENYEGLATFTSILLSTNTSEECVAKLLEYLKRIYSVQSYGRSYGSIHGALYSYLLYEKSFDFRIIRSDTLDLAEEVRKLYSIELPEICRDVAGSLSFGYNVEDLYKEEEKRLNDIKESVHKLTSTFTEKPVVFIELASPYFDFEPEDIHILDTLGTLYNTIHVSDNWGKLTVDDGGCLISANLKYLRVTARGYKAEKNHISGDGWQLVLNDNWQLIRVEQNYFLRQLMP
jgi:hypothetical protein